MEWECKMDINFYVSPLVGSFRHTFCRCVALGKLIKCLGLNFRIHERG